MKHLIQISLFICALSLGNLKTNAQLNNLIRFLPHEGPKGYLVLNSPEELKIHSWLVKIYQSSFTGDSYNHILETDFKITDNYTSIPEKFYTTESDLYSIEVIALDENQNSAGSSGIHILSDDHLEGWNDGPFFEEQCALTCNGKDYAYEIRVMEKSTGGSYILALFDAVHYENSNGAYIPYYQYMTHANWSILIQNNPSYNLAYHGLTDFTIDGTNIVKYTNTNWGDYKDKDGNPLSGTVYGVRKAKGPWINSAAQTPELVNSHLYCATPGDPATVESAITELNDYYDFVAEGYPALECSGITWSVSDPSGGGDFNWPDEVECIFELNMIDYWVNDTFNWNGYQNAATDCFANSFGSSSSGANNGNGTAINWADEIEEMQFYRVDESKPVISITKDDLYKANGEYKGIDLSLEKGLYIFAIRLSNGQYLPQFVEFPENIEAASSQADMVDIKAFPNPVTKKTFDIEITAKESLSFSYTLMDFNGQILSTKNITISKGQTKVKKINPNPDLQADEYYINKFVFDDGSEKSIMITK